jgi:DNA-binding response OmpR family regulator
MEQMRLSPNVKRPGILVADGEAARLLADYLSQQGFHATHTSQGQDVLRLARSGRVALAIVDVLLRDMSGLVLVSQLKEIDPKIHVLMTTADYRPELELRSRQVGILYYACKPTDRQLLTAVVAKAVGGSESG